MDIQLGDKGPEVEHLQRVLQQAGFPIDVDGDFGRQTEKAVEAFQVERGLAVDGIAGPDTLAALGIGGEQDAGREGDSAPVTDVDFEETEEVVPPEVRMRIAALVEKVIKAVDQTLSSAEQAINQFETTMKFSSNDIDESLPSSLMAEVLQAVAEQLVQRLSAVVPTFDETVGFAGGLFGTVVDNLAAAGAKSESNSAGDWIKNQRVVLDTARREFAGRGSKDLASDVESDFLASDDKPAMFDGIVQATDQLTPKSLPAISEFEARLYEQWINEHFDGLGDDGPGCVEYRYDFDDNVFDFVSCTVAAPFGSAIEAGLNRLFNERLVPWAQRPLELHVRKRACFRVDNVNPGGKSWQCGWLDEQGDDLSRPFNDTADRAFDEPIWRHAKRFARVAD